MPVVEVSETVRAPIDLVWKTICDLENYPAIMEPVKRLIILGSRDGEIISEWDIDLKGSLLRWTQAETHDSENRLIEFHQIDGDLEKFEGFWKVEEGGDGITKAVLSVDFEIGIPMLKDMLNPVAERALRENSIKMIRSLEIAGGETMSLADEK